MSIKIENVVVPSAEQWRAIIMGTRNPLNSWARSDSKFAEEIDFDPDDYPCGFELGPNDLDLMMRLAKAGSEHRKFMRMITVYVDITAPLYWWKEFDTYRVGVEKNSCSTMHKIHVKEFTIDDFSNEHLGNDSLSVLQFTIDHLNRARDAYLETKDKDHWWQMIQLLPSSYNQKRTVQMNYEVLAAIYRQRKGHKLDEWQVFREWIETLPYSEIITLKEPEDEPCT